MTVKIGEIRGELIAVTTTKFKGSQRETHALVEVLVYGGVGASDKVAVSVPINLDQYAELAEHVGRQVRISFDVFPAKS